jgi:hypothetical protein
MLLLAVADHGHAFRNCQIDGDSAAFRGSSRYLVGELALEAASGTASGTETHYNYSNTGPAGLDECHVTYELTGIYDVGSALLLLDAELTNQSRNCDPDFVDARYPDYRSYTLSLQRSPDGLTELIDADSGEVLAIGDPADRTLLYRTDESCVLN